jgi:four helix bundle protein
MQDFRKLRVWSKAYALAINTRRATDRFPRRGYAELKAQMISAAESVVHNIVEGCGAASQKEFARFLGISIKSSMELEGEFQLARGYGVLAEQDWIARRRETSELRRMLYALRVKVINSDLSGSISHAEPTAQNRKPTTPRDLLQEDAEVHPVQADATSPRPPQTPQTTSAPPTAYPSALRDATAPP